MLDQGELQPICESKSRFAVKWVDAHGEFALQPIEIIGRTKAAALRTVCLSSSNVRGGFQLAVSSVQWVEFAPLFSEREQLGFYRPRRDFGQKASGIPTGLN